MYIMTMKTKTSQTHLFRVKFGLYFFGIFFSIGSVYKNLILPFYYLKYQRNETADLETPFGSNIVPPLTAFFDELNFITLPIMSWIIYRTIHNKTVIARSKRRKRGQPKRANSFDSRRTQPLIDIVLQANEEL